MSNGSLLKKAIDYEAEFERVFEEFRDSIREVGCWTEFDEANLDDWNDSLASLFYAFIKEKQVGAIKRIKKRLRNEGLRLYCQKCGKANFQGFGDRKITCGSCGFRTTHNAVHKNNIEIIFKDEVGDLK